MSDPKQTTISTRISDELMKRWQQAMEAKDAAVGYANQLVDDVELCVSDDDVSCSAVAGSYYDAAEETVIAAIQSDEAQALVHAARKYGPIVLSLAQGHVTGAVQRVVVREAVERAPQVADVVAETVVPKAKEVVSRALETGGKIIEEHCSACDAAFGIIGKTLDDVGKALADGQYDKLDDALLYGAHGVYELIVGGGEELPVQPNPELTPPVSQSLTEIFIAEAEVEPFDLGPEPQDVEREALTQTLPEPSQEETSRAIVVSSASTGELTEEKTPDVKVTTALGVEETVESEEAEQASVATDVEDVTEEVVADACPEESPVDESRCVAQVDTAQEVEEKSTQSAQEEAVAQTSWVDDLQGQSSPALVEISTKIIGEEGTTRRASAAEVAQAGSSAEREIVAHSEAGIETTRGSMRLAAQRGFAATAQQIDGGRDFIEGATQLFSQTLPAVAVAGLSSYAQELVKQQKEIDRQRRPGELNDDRIVAGIAVFQQTRSGSIVDDGVVANLETEAEGRNLFTVSGNGTASGSSASSEDPDSLIAQVFAARDEDLVVDEEIGDYSRQVSLRDILRHPVDVLV